MTAASACDDNLVQMLRAALEPHGLFLRGTVNFVAGEAAPQLKGGAPAASVLLVGNIGGSLWEPFSRWRADQPDQGGMDPLDNWSKQIIQPVAERLDATAYYPSDPPWQPFQRWAMRAEGLKPSPLGILIHPKYGLWHGYRGALGFDRVLPQTDKVSTGHPCDACVGKPCISACPADALAARAFDVARCRTHLRSKEEPGGCLALGCLSRDVCPVGRDFRYPDAQLRFHMAALRL
ncbi:MULTISPECIES: 4Fe-4S dicluster domain-containing protein [Sinorhizobium]|uniref:Ferredoxin n=2 Tax=Sinorhizobium TaxID=28105 RepID=A0A2S3YPT8_9HYPH|nr:MULTISPECIES: 4Fe-4S dicluster domain-containing protein [Sinorhizobium]AUX76748.1 ferredoxin domain-containing protein [Sinorhizobium fredii]PDT42958.1 ferredoxin [Sinorhizobium sp. FG01]POH32881.1 ferredoxin [Sinorhizobium americanum]